MASKTLFFPGFAKVLFGSRPLSCRESHLKTVREEAFGSFAELLQSRLPKGHLDALASLGRNRRSRSYPASTTFWLFIWQILNLGSAFRGAVKRLIAETASGNSKQEGAPKNISQNISAYCQARVRLPLGCTPSPWQGFRPRCSTPSRHKLAMVWSSGQGHRCDECLHAGHL